MIIREVRTKLYSVVNRATGNAPCLYSSKGFDQIE